MIIYGAKKYIICQQIAILVVVVDHTKLRRKGNINIHEEKRYVNTHKGLTFRAKLR